MPHGKPLHGVFSVYVLVLSALSLMVSSGLAQDDG
jgi:hypothetical protein